MAKIVSDTELELTEPPSDFEGGVQPALCTMRMQVKREGNQVMSGSHAQPQLLSPSDSTRVQKEDLVGGTLFGTAAQGAPGLLTGTYIPQSLTGAECKKGHHFLATKLLKSSRNTYCKGNWWDCGSFTTNMEHRLLRWLASPAGDNLVWGV